MTSHRKTFTGGALVILIILFVALMLVVNVLFRGARVDLTENNLYTLSSGTTQILGELKEPINLYFYFSDNLNFLKSSGHKNNKISSFTKKS